MAEGSESKFNHHEFFSQITKVERDKRCETFTEIFSTLPSESQQTIRNCCEKFGDVCERRIYLQTILFVLKSLHENVLSTSKTFLSVKEYRAVRTVIEDAVSIGIIPNLESGILCGRENLYPLSVPAKPEKLSDMVKYDRLKTTIGALRDYYEEISLKPAIVINFGPILAGLFKLAHQPLMKPSKSQNPDSTKFNMTEDLYAELIQDQLEFTDKLRSFIENCQLCLVMREMLGIGSPKSPKWLQERVKQYLVKATMEPTGIYSVILAVCNDCLNSDTDWKFVNRFATLIAISYGENVEEKYYESICSQFLSLLEQKNLKYSALIANICIKTLYEIKPVDCQERIINFIVEPLMTKVKKLMGNLVLQEESKISECIERLNKCFSPEDPTYYIQYLPSKSIEHISLPLFYMYMETMNGVSLLKSQVKKLLIFLLEDSDSWEDLFQAFLEPFKKSEKYFGEKLCFRFGPSGGLEIVSLRGEYEYEQVYDGLFNLVIEHKDLSAFFFQYLLRVRADIEAEDSGLDLDGTRGMLLLKGLAASKQLLKLANNKECQKAQINDLQSTLKFVESLISGIIKKDSCKAEDQVQTVHASLMLVKSIIEEKEPNDWSVFEPLAALLSEMVDKDEVHESSTALVKELLTVLKKKKRTPSLKSFRDLNIGNLKNKAFNDALRDVTDPLLPVRAHGLMQLTRLIASADPSAVAKKDLLLYLFQLNLKDDDSFIYLTAINGLIEMAYNYPEGAIETLVQVFIDIPNLNKTDEIAPEVRVKVGEVLVKATSGLGEMAYGYKDILINGFLYGARDSDPIIRTSSLSCLGEVCKVLGFRLGNAITEILFCVTCIIETDKDVEARRAAVLVINLLIHGLGKDTLTELGNDLVPVYRGLKHLRDNDNDYTLRFHAQLALEKLDDIVQSFLFSKPDQMNIFFHLGV